MDDQNVVFESIQDETADDYGGFVFNMDAGTTEPYFDVSKNNSTLMRVDGGGNVGIGTTNPGAKLEVVGGTALRFRNATLDGFTIGQLNTNSWGISGLSASMKFSVQNSDLYVPHGNVGIGTTSPGYPLDIVGFANSSSGFRVTDGTIDNRMSWSSGNIGFFGTISNHPIAFNTNSIERMRINLSRQRRDRDDCSGK